jgi:hypothetical protein
VKRKLQVITKEDSSCSTVKKSHHSGRAARALAKEGAVEACVQAMSQAADDTDLISKGILLLGNIAGIITHSLWSYRLNFQPIACTPKPVVKGDGLRTAMNMMIAHRKDEDIQDSGLSMMRWMWEDYSAEMEKLGWAKVCSEEKY